MSLIEGNGQEDQPDPRAGYADHPAWERLEDQIRWHNKKSVVHQWLHKFFSITQAVAVVVIPPVGMIDLAYSMWLITFLSVSVAILEVIQQKNSYYKLWKAYRKTAECLKREKLLFQSTAGHYKGIGEPERLILLAECMAELCCGSSTARTNRPLDQQNEAHSRDD